MQVRAQTHQPSMNRIHQGKHKQNCAWEAAGGCRECARCNFTEPSLPL
jgi:hypothetical protein